MITSQKVKGTSWKFEKREDSYTVVTPQATINNCGDAVFLYDLHVEWSTE